MRPRQPAQAPPAPPPPPSPPKIELPDDAGFWFGRSHQLEIDTSAVCGRYIAAKNRLNQIGMEFPLPKLFEEGGDVSMRRKGGNKGKKGKKGGKGQHPRVAAVMGLVALHEGEFRKWNDSWGPKNPENPAVGGSDDWVLIKRAAPPRDHPFYSHHQLHAHPGCTSTFSSFPMSTILRQARGQPLTAAYEARDVYICNLAELFLAHIDHKTAAELYQQWLEAEVIIGKRPRRGRPRGGKGK